MASPKLHGRNKVRRFPPNCDLLHIRRRVRGEPTFAEPHRAEPKAGQKCLDELDAVVEEQRNAISGLHAVAGENRGDPGGAIVKLGVGSGVVAEYNSEMVRVRSARTARELGQRQPA